MMENYLILIARNEILTIRSYFGFIIAVQWWGAVISYLWTPPMIIVNFEIFS
jgi:hypothetical protein